MTDSACPPGWSHNPSAWPWRLPTLVLALTGLGIATYLALYQLGILTQVWEPFFGNGSQAILKESSFAHLLPIPDALLGAFVYLVEAIAECVGGQERWRRWPGAVFATGAVTAALGVAAVVLVSAQALLFHAFCTLCLASAACSLVIVLLVWPEVRAALGQRHAQQSATGARRGLRQGIQPGTPGSR